MRTLLIILLFAAIAALAFERPRSAILSMLRLSSGRMPWPFADGGENDEPFLSSLTRNLYLSLVSPQRASWFGRRIVVPEDLAIVAAPDDCQRLRREKPVIAEDLSAAVKANTKRHRIQATLPLRIIDVVADGTGTIARGQPQLMSLEEAVIYAGGPPALNGDAYAAVGTPTAYAGSPARAYADSPASAYVDDQVPPYAKASAAESSTGRDFPQHDPADIEVSRPLSSLGMTRTDEAQRTRATLFPLKKSNGKLGPLNIGPMGLTLGRSPDCGAGHVAVETVSRRHAWIGVKAGSWMLLDQGSHNGSYVNGQIVSSRRLATGDVIGLGHDIAYRFVDGNELYGKTMPADGEQDAA